MEMTRSILKHMSVPNYLWGEGVRHATYLINRVMTKSLNLQVPYEVYKGVKPNIKHVRVFGCVVYAKTESQHLRKLDDRSRTLVHLGTEPGSKAYRLLCPTSRRIVVSRDVVFDEDKRWKWSSTNKEDDESGTFVIDSQKFIDQERRDDEVEEETNENINETVDDTTSEAHETEGIQAPQETEDISELR